MTLLSPRSLSQPYTFLVQCSLMSRDIKTPKLDSVPDTKKTGKKTVGKARVGKSTTIVKMGRPSKYTQDLADDICSRIAEGRSLRSIIRDDESLPDMKTIFNWFRAHDDFLQQYTRAKEESADSLADDIIDLADQVQQGKIDPNAGRVAGDLKKWSASKLKPKKYGDKLDLTSGGEKLPTPILAHGIESKLETKDGSKVIEGEVVDPVKELEQEIS